jgi:glycine/D-amino acid oxidase-like deaminating enzyme
MNNPYDAIVIGAGISGGWAAKELYEQGLMTLFPRAVVTGSRHGGTAPRGRHTAPVRETQRGCRRNSAPPLRSSGDNHII